MGDETTTIAHMKQAIQQFTTERGWKPDARSLAISVSIEAAELLEHFQWRRYMRKDDRDEVIRELADVVIYCLQFAMELKIDVAEAVAAKLEESANKYPAALFTDGQDGASNYYAAKDAARRERDGRVTDDL